MVQGDGEGLCPRQLARDRNLDRIIVFSLGYFLYNSQNSHNETLSIMINRSNTFLLESISSVQLLLSSSVSVHT